MSRTIFKVPLELIPIDDSGTPQFLSIVCDFIKDQSKCEGIFRKSGHEKMIIKINEKLAQHVPEMPKDATVHDAANFLKRWLMLLPTPLFDPKIINVHCKENSPQSFISAISKLPQINQICLMHIFDVASINFKNSSLILNGFEYSIVDILICDKKINKVLIWFRGHFKIKTNNEIQSLYIKFSSSLVINNKIPSIRLG